MKKRLLTPPARDGEILLIPPPGELPKLLSGGDRRGTAHQPAFFNPGVALKFLLLRELPGAGKEIIFVDTDRISIEINLPPAGPDGAVSCLELIESDDPLICLPAPSPDFWEKHFRTVEERLVDPEVIANFRRFREIFSSYLDRGFLKELLALSFLDYFDLPSDFIFLSDLLGGEEFRAFFTEILRREKEFREIFNQALREYKETFRFRYKNYPFPPLKDGELPFWRLEGGKRVPLFSNDVGPDGLKPGTTVLPRAVTLTLFLRLHRYDLFIHGIGGGNYEWVQDRMIERFYGAPRASLRPLSSTETHSPLARGAEPRTRQHHSSMGKPGAFWCAGKKNPGRYVIVSGTFLLGESKERDYPYFFYSPDKIKKRLAEVLTTNSANLH